MPFMRGRAPIRRTLQYLQSGQILFRDSVKVFAINYNTAEDHHHHHGARDFIFWYMPQVQYQNQDVQCITFKNLTPSPFITVFMDTGKKILVDIDSRTKDEISNHLKNFAAICKTQEELKYEARAKEKKDNPANFGYGCDRHCVCELQGQVPCPCIVPLPNHMRGKYRFAQD